MMLVRKARLAGLLLMTTAAMFLAVPTAWAASVSVTDLTEPGEKIGADVRRAVLGINMTGSGTFQGVSVVLQDVGGDGDFELTLLSDLQGSPDGVAVYRDNSRSGVNEDALDSGDIRVSSGFTNSNGSVDVNVSSSIPAGAEMAYTYFLVVQTSTTITEGDDFTVAISGGLCPFQTNPITLICSGGSTGTITADTTPPAQPVLSPPATVDGNIVWTFAENVVGVSADNVVLREDGSPTDIAAAVTYDENTFKATINPSALLSAGGTYDTIVNPGAATTLVTDEAGNPAPLTQETFSLGGFSPGVVRGNSWHLTGVAPFDFAKATDYPISGDWDDDGDYEPGVVRGNVWYLADNSPPSSVISFPFGKATDFPIVGDWDGDGDDEPGLVRGNTWYLSDDSPPTEIRETFLFGKATDYPIAGDWNGANGDEPGLVRGNVWYLSNDAPPTSIAHSFTFAKATDFPMAGDWDDDGAWTVGVVRGNVWHLANETIPETLTSFAFGTATDFPVAGDWDGPSSGSTGGAGLLPKLVPGS